LRKRHRDRVKFVHRQKKVDLATIFLRLSALFLMILFISTLVYLNREHYEESDGSSITFIDAVYFTMVSITTTGYGDIIPASQGARLFDTILITSGRAALWFVIVGTTYQFIYDRYREAFILGSKRNKLKDHVVLCGYGTTGRTAAKEMMAKGWKRDSLVVISNDQEDSQNAADEGFLSIQGDATKEEVLNGAVIKKAGTLVITTGKDDTNVLISLTARYMNPGIRIVSRVTDPENIKILKKSGVEITIAPSVSSGSLMATAISQPRVVHLLEDIMTSSQGIFISQRSIREEEVGRSPKGLRGITVFGVLREDRVLTLEDMDDLELRDGDSILFIDRKR